MKRTRTQKKECTGAFILVVDTQLPRETHSSLISVTKIKVIQCNSDLCVYGYTYMFIQQNVIIPLQLHERQISQQMFNF